VELVEVERVSVETLAGRRAVVIDASLMTAAIVTFTRVHRCHVSKSSYTLNSFLAGKKLPDVQRGLGFVG